MVDELNDATERRMDEQTDRIRALEAERDAEKLNRQGVEDELARTCAALVNARDAEVAAVKRAEEAERRFREAMLKKADDLSRLLGQLSEAQAREGRRKEALEAWGILRYAERDQDDQDTGRMLERCRECGRKAVQPAPIQHKKRCLVAAALSPSPVSGAAAKEPSDG